ncbi:hypothetical protein DYB32_001140 [Aphanomyces invadans]|uniref:MOSC domain-containing protein n=1 Tax=Aphanomyces invadans TaxID=157072 RepID=A0A418B7F9_9STRA|nr:hypothetical protein DYB32_001140 [Aphanomyces invadans]
MDEGYGYGTAQGEDILSKLRAERFRHLEGQVYLDHAGATIYGSHQVEQHATLLKQNLFGNPHSSSAVSSQRTTEEIDSARRDVAAFFHASLEEYDVVFTSGATAGLKLVGESFPFTRQSSFAYSVNAHNSVLGIRSFANARGATMFALPVELLDAVSGMAWGTLDSDLSCAQVGQAATQSIHQDETNNEKDVYNLVAFPGECNFSGAKHPLSTIDALHRNVLNIIPLEKCQVPSKQPVHHPQGKWLVLLDAAKLAGTNPIDLGEVTHPLPMASLLYVRTPPVPSSCLVGHVCGDAMDVIHDRPTGAIRVSFGYMTTKQDVDAFLAFVVQYYVSALPTTTVMEAPPMRIESTTIRLSKITLFPIKSCGGMSVSGWAVGPDGLFYDREWALVDPETLKTFSQKDLPKMATLRPVVDLEAQALNITMSDSTPVSPLSIPLTYVPSLTTVRSLHGKKYDDLVNAWFTNVLGRPCALVRVSKESRRSRLTPSKAQHAIGFANEAPFLLISRASVTLMNSKFGSDVDEDVFRANFIVDGCDAHAEDRWSEVAIGSHSLAVLGPCGRCTMVNINQTTGESEAGPLKHLASYRRDRGKIYFGQFLALKASDSFRIRVGDTIAPLAKPHETSA